DLDQAGARRHRQAFVQSAGNHVFRALQGRLADVHRSTSIAPDPLVKLSNRRALPRVKSTGGGFEQMSVMVSEPAYGDVGPASYFHGSSWRADFGQATGQVAAFR